MKSIRTLKKNNRGASLLAVLVVLVVVSAIAVIITKLTITNIQMKEVERGTKKNFYSAESVMDELYTGAGEKALDAMGVAYQDVLEHYLDYTAAGKNLQTVFTRKYMDNLENTFWDGTSAKNTKDNASSEVIYSISKYNVNTVRSCIATAANQPCLITAEADASYDADYDAGEFTLNNVKVSYTDAQGYETTITTNLVFTTPQMNFSGGNQVKEFMKYCLIADKKIEVNSNPVTVAGNAYAGAEGIEAITNGSGTFTGKKIVTRGTIATQSSSNLVLGNGNTAIWAENIETTGKGASALTINGSCFVADDLTLNGVGSNVTLQGNYYGYNFQQNYDAQNLSRDAQFSSAMMVNSRECKLDLQGLNYLMLAGRTFISRGNNVSNNDVMLGESISARTNQLAYYVPRDYIDEGALNFTSDGLVKFEKDTGIAAVDSYLGSPQVVAYHYIEKGNGLAAVNYYLNFASEQKANDYFSAYCSSEKGNMFVNKYAANYLSDDAIILDPNRIFTLKGDIMYRDTPGTDLKAKNVTIDATSWDAAGAFFELSSQLAVKYKSLQLGLTESRPGVVSSDVRLLGADGKVDKTINPMFDELIDRSTFEIVVNSNGSVVGSGGKEYVPVSKALAGGTHYQGVILVDNDGEGAYSIPTTYSQGIVVATGDVYVPLNFTGMIISGGTIRFATNVTVSSDEMMVSELFADDMDPSKTPIPLFSHLFNDCGSGLTGGSLSGNIDVSLYLNYEKWKKN